MKFKHLLIPIVLLLFSVACEGTNGQIWSYPPNYTPPTATPTQDLSIMPTAAPSRTPKPTDAPTAVPTAAPTATRVPTNAPTNTAVPTSTKAPTTSSAANIATPGLPMTGKLFLSPVRQTSTFNQKSAWLIGEPGRICTPECPWTLLATDTTYSGNAAEGGFLYVSAGQLNMVADGVRFELSYQDGNNNIVLVRGRPDDGKIDTDLNTTVQLTGFKPGHGIFTMIPVGAYVSKDWFRDQLKVSMNVENAGTSWSNCGATGCTKTTILLFDIDSHGYQKFVVYATNIDDWSLLESNIK